MLFGFGLGLWFSAAMILLVQPAAAEPEINWRVGNPFRLFADPTNSEVHRATFDALTEDERKHPILSAERALAERHPDG